MRTARYSSRDQRGYILLSIMLLMTLMLIALTIEAPRIGQQIKREKEEELIHRANEYKSAIRKYFRKFGQYPVSLDQLDKTNNMRFLRKRYKDPFTGKDDWRLLHVGEVQLNVTGGASTVGQGPGQPIGGIQPAGGPAGQPIAGGSINPPQGTPATDQGAAAPAPGGTASTATGAGTTAGPGASSGPGTTSPFSSPNSGIFGSSSGSSGQFGGGPVIGVESVSKLSSIKEIDGKSHYNEWPFFYDPRLEQQAAPLGAGGVANPIGGPGAPGQAPGQGFGQNPGGMNQPGGMSGPPNQNTIPIPRPN